MIEFTFFALIFLVSNAPVISQLHESSNIETVEEWASQLGKELWELGSEITRLEEIKMKYEVMNASVLPTDGEQILDTIVQKMNHMIRDKVDAVMRIKDAAETAELNSVYDKFAEAKNSYRSAKFSDVEFAEPGLGPSKEYKIPTITGQDVNDPIPARRSYSCMVLKKDEHFYGIPVNISYSAVHVPTNIFDRWANVDPGIQWSAALDETFVENYRRDPTLMWQYFGSASGFLRHYPAFRWNMDPDEYDCRTRIWYIQAATCSKEVVILVDNSGSMDGMRKSIAYLTVSALLNTFSNNDYINVLNFSDVQAHGMVPCFNRTLVQATPENIELFREAAFKLEPTARTNYTVAFMEALDILHQFNKNKTGNVETRNQAIFLLTDDMPTEFDRIKEIYREIYNDTNISVDLFVYFLGLEIPNIRELQWDRCLRKGSLVHVRTMDEVKEDTLKYVDVIGRTQIESHIEHPVTWTHIFNDVEKDRGTKPMEQPTKTVTKCDDKLIFNANHQYEMKAKVTEINATDLEKLRASSTPAPEEATEEPEPDVESKTEEFTRYRIMTSVSTPVYSRKNSTKYKDGKREMLGVAAIDVPITDFIKLTLPHKIGVNGYAFIVTNNGYLLFHPDLRAVRDGTLRNNFNSIDLTEVEFIEDDIDEPRQPNKKIYDLREQMVNQKNGNMSELAIKFHYDDQKRVGSESRNYYYAPLSCSPYTLGLALPRGYGNYWIKTYNEIEKSKLENESYAKYFQGNWRIHPEWVYCDYRGSKKGEFDSAENKLIHFIKRIFSANWTWIEQYPSTRADSNAQGECSAYTPSNQPITTREMEDYYCDKELMELLYFDAKLTHFIFKEKTWQPTAKELEMIQENKIQTRFVATQGGLIRWQDVSNERPSNFGEIYKRALEEVWYKSAVLLHHLDSRNFVFSLPTMDHDTNESVITASHAIFHNRNGNEAPGVVVGFQLSHQTLINKLDAISSKSKNLRCSFGDVDCYLIDANGYIIVSQPNTLHTGKFFGTVEGAVMEELVSKNIFRRIPMFDYQAVAPRQSDKNNATLRSRATTFLKPINHLKSLLYWTLTSIASLLLQVNILCIIPYASSSEESTTNSQVDKTEEIDPPMESVDAKYDLYLFQNLSAYGYISEKKQDSKNCSRPFYVRRIDYTNMLLVVVDPNHQTCYRRLEVSPQVISYNSKYPHIPACNKLNMNSYPRKKLRGCNEKQVAERIYEKCGQSHLYSRKWILFLMLFIYTIRFHI